MTLVGLTESFDNGVVTFKQDLARTSSAATKTIWRCSTPPMPTSSATAWTCRKNPKRAQPPDPSA
jgi:hypothetical protein